MKRGCNAIFDEIALKEPVQMPLTLRSALVILCIQVFTMFSKIKVASGLLCVLAAFCVFQLVTAKP